MEITIGAMLAHHGRSFYVFAQTFAVPVNFAAFFSGAPISLPMYQFGLFKLGFPEITSSLMIPIKKLEKFEAGHGVVMGRLLAACLFVDGLFLLVHHIGGTLIYTLVILGEVAPGQLGVVALTVALQHLFSFVKHSNFGVCVLLALEVWFEAETFYHLTFSEARVQVGLWMLLVAHWAWFLTACVGLFEPAARTLHIAHHTSDEGGGEQQIAHGEKQKSLRNLFSSFKRMQLLEDIGGQQNKGKNEAIELEVRDEGLESTTCSINTTGMIST